MFELVNINTSLSSPQLTNLPIEDYDTELLILALSTWACDYTSLSYGRWYI